MKVNKKGYIDSFIEKPTKTELPKWSSPVSKENKKIGKQYLASMGIYIFSKGALKKLFEEHPEANDFGKEIIPAAITANRKVASYEYNGYWTDIGTISSFFEANLELTDNIPDFHLFDNMSPVYTRPRMLPPSKVFGTMFRKAMMAEGCIIHAERIERSIIGIRSRIQEYSVISNSIVMGNDYFQQLDEIIDADKIPMGVGRHCIIENAILDKDCCIGDNVVIRGNPKLKDTETDSYCIRDGIVVVKNGPSSRTIPASEIRHLLNKEQLEMRSENALVTCTRYKGIVHY